MKNKSSGDKYFYKLSGKIFMFARNNLAFKSINMLKKKYFKDIYRNLKLKKLTKQVILLIEPIFIKRI